MRVVLAAALLVGCASAPEIVVTPVVDEYGTVACQVGDDVFELTEAERRDVINGLVRLYCPIR
jgi:uncharacterized protein YcfL